MKTIDTIGERIRWLRKQQLKMTLVDFSARLGISNPAVSMIENGKTNPSEQTIRAICREFGVDELWLREGIGEPFAAKSREAEVGEMLKSLLSERPESFRSRLLTAFLRFDPNGDEWKVLEAIYKSVANEKETADPD